MSALKLLAALGPLIAAAIGGTDRKIITHLRSAGALTILAVVAVLAAIFLVSPLLF